MEAFFDFEKPIVNLEKKLQDLRELAKAEGVDFASEISKLEKKVSQLIDETYAKLTPWQKVQLSRHPGRPYTRDYVDLLFPDFMELQGDRAFGEDQAILGGVAMWPPVNPAQPDDRGTERIPVLILGHQKGRNTKQKMERNFGMAKPEGYRKAIRLMELAERCRMPIITLIDTPGAYPGLDAEERGQSQAIAESIHAMFQLTVPVAAIVIGEGGSGGALALGCANVVLMQEYSVYSVISPESCASILWSDSSLAERASERLKMSPNELLKFGVIDAVIPEPKGGAHRDIGLAGQLLRDALIKHFEPLLRGRRKNGKKLMNERLDKFRKMGELALDHAPM
ncbi:MAG: acetyl-CoA carboxylase carboxyltransferase subunit alpha [Oligoflexia bacterium]|nr:acetyl-CoA carboxylase carboxyltransferase subunit alpha [Oligoflexia bacterium]